jgi:hypothetical protein
MREIDLPLQWYNLSAWALLVSIGVGCWEGKEGVFSAKRLINYARLGQSLSMQFDGLNWAEIEQAIAMINRLTAGFNQAI